MTAASFILYCIGIAFAGVLIITTVLAIFATGRLLAIINFLFSLLSFLALGIGSAVLTAFMVKVTDIINDRGNSVGIYAKKGSKFLTITWVATGLMLLTLISWVVLFIIGRKHSSRRVRTEKDVVHN